MITIKLIRQYIVYSDQKWNDGTGSDSTFGGSISGETAPPQYSNTGDLEELILSACSTARWSIHTITFLLESPLKETETGELSESTATVVIHEQCYIQIKLNSPCCKREREQQFQNYIIPREQVAANPRPCTSVGATLALEQAAFTAAQTASHISVEDCCLEQKDESTL